MAGGAVTEERFRTILLLLGIYYLRSLAVNPTPASFNIPQPVLVEVQKKTPFSVDIPQLSEQYRYLNNAGKIQTTLPLHIELHRIAESVDPTKGTTP